MLDSLFLLSCGHHLGQGSAAKRLKASARHLRSPGTQLGAWRLSLAAASTITFNNLGPSYPTKTAWWVGSSQSMAGPSSQTRKFEKWRYTWIAAMLFLCQGSQPNNMSKHRRGLMKLTKTQNHVGALLQENCWHTRTTMLKPKLCIVVHRMHGDGSCVRACVGNIYSIPNKTWKRCSFLSMCLICRVPRDSEHYQICCKCSPPKHTKKTSNNASNVFKKKNTHTQYIYIYIYI